MRRVVSLAVVLLACCLLLATPASTRTAGGGAGPYRYIYNSSSAAQTVLANGWNLVDVGSKSSADDLPRGARGLVWVGDYDNGSCSWETGDAEIRHEVSSAVGDRKVFGFFISDEPNPYKCPSAPAQHRARSVLIHSINPRTKTVIVLDSNGFSGRATKDALLQLPLWRGTADYIGLDPYPCYQGEACDFTWIARTIAAANAAGLNYWGVIQAFDGSSWRWPTASELTHMVNQWTGSRETGSMTFAWTWDGHDLSSRPELLAVLRAFNGRRGNCVVPNVKGSSLKSARARLARAGCLTGRVTRRFSSRASGHVIAQRPKPGTRLPALGRVALVISKGRR